MNQRENIYQKISDSLKPMHIEVIDESHNHNVPEGSQSHFKVTVVSEKFDGLMLIKRHRLINDILRDELDDQIHALALHTMTPEQWYEKGGEAPESPPCLGGGKSDA